MWWALQLFSQLVKRAEAFCHHGCSGWYWSYTFCPMVLDNNPIPEGKWLSCKHPFSTWTMSWGKIFEARFANMSSCLFWWQFTFTFPTWLLLAGSSPLPASTFRSHQHWMRRLGPTDAFPSFRISPGFILQASCSSWTSLGCRSDKDGRATEQAWSASFFFSISCNFKFWSFAVKCIETQGPSSDSRHVGHGLSWCQVRCCQNHSRHLRPFIEVSLCRWSSR